MLRSFDKLRNSFSAEQLHLYEIADENASELTSLTNDAIYKAGFLEGYAVGRIVGGGREQ
jgi:hypothetical protein